MLEWDGVEGTRGCHPTIFGYYFQKQLRHRNPSLPPALVALLTSSSEVLLDVLQEGQMVSPPFPTPPPPIRNA